MAKSIKKSDAAPKAAAKPRKTAKNLGPAKNQAVVLQMENPKRETRAPVSHEQVAELAHRFWNERGRQHGHHEEDWFRAEELLRGKAS